MKFVYRKRVATPSAARQEIYASGMRSHEAAPTWMVWDDETTLLHLSPKETVNLRVGDQILVAPGTNGQFDIHGYRPRVEH